MPSSNVHGAGSQDGDAIASSGVLICLGVGLEEFSAARSDDRRTRQGQCCRPRLREDCATGCKTGQDRQRQNRKAKKYRALMNVNFEPILRGLKSDIFD